ncbi:hypothetical protein RIF29_39607 [Crotalaria pallida]|uniref:MADS-box domain-containing protein n=1 Tax=Crotalaria pallida TaxID=3830 RepID=A0AAN9E367_CROPI
MSSKRKGRERDEGGKNQTTTIAISKKKKSEKHSTKATTSMSKGKMKKGEERVVENHPTTKATTKEKGKKKVTSDDDGGESDDDYGGESHDHQTKAKEKRRRATLKLIPSLAARRACYRKRRQGLLKKMEEISVLCDIEACVFVHGPGDDEPTVWPSKTVANELVVQRLQEASEENSRVINKVDQRDCVRDENKKKEDKLARMKKRNEERYMFILMHRIYEEGEPLSNLEASDLKRLLCYSEEKLKGARKRISLSEKMPNPNPMSPPISCPKENEILGGSNMELAPLAYHDLDDIDMELLDDMEFWSELQEMLDLEEEADQVNNGGIDRNNNVGSNLELPPNANNQADIDMVLSESDFASLNNGENDHLEALAQENDFGVLPQDHFRDLNGEIDYSIVSAQRNFEGLVDVVNDDMEVLPQVNFRDLNGSEIDQSIVSIEENFKGLNLVNDFGVLPQNHFSDLSGEIDRSIMLPHENFRDLNVENDFGVLSQDHFGDLNSEINYSIALPEGNFRGFNVENDLKVPPQINFKSLNDNIDSMHLYAGSTSGTSIGMGKHNENLGEPFGDTNSEVAAMGRFNANFAGASNESNLNTGLFPSHGNIDPIDDGIADILECLNHIKELSRTL